MLIIEDEPFVALGIELALADAGATSFDIAVTEADAIAAAIAHVPALITSDVTLIEGNGPAAVAAIIEQLGSIPVIFIIATPDACRPSGARAIFLAKPVREATLAEAFHRLI